MAEERAGTRTGGAAMEIQTELEIDGPLTELELRIRAREARLRAAGIRVPPGPWPPKMCEPIKPRFYHLRRMFWPLRRLIKRVL